MNKFGKVSFEEYKKSIGGDCDLTAEYNDIQLPKRATKRSAGYDFFAPCDITLAPGEGIKIPTGIKVQIKDNQFLAAFPRSGLGFKYRLQLDNTVGIIDSDYYGNPSNEGHIFAKITNDSKDGKTVTINKGTAFMQGIFLSFDVTVDDEVTAERQGGLGSTTK